MVGIHRASPLAYSWWFIYGFPEVFIWRRTLMPIKKLNVDCTASLKDDVCLHENISRMDVHKYFKEDEETNTNKRKIGPRFNLNKITQTTMMRMKKMMLVAIR
ncbi:unnamed protein product [Lactuca saligna]|uniref:Uncharacterized protein n=1 Tax=Lactuca saligna TaxID=75948 RepID=A0AA36A115_LACSI|nr:unnamed protein product [Lactuca saligna]